MKLSGSQLMFRRPITFALIALVTLSCLLLLNIAKVEKKDLQEVEKLMKPESVQKKGLSYSETVREGVVKEIWMGAGDLRHVRISSKESALFFFQEGKSIESVEQLGGVCCFMQERLFFQEGKPMQEVRYLEAKKACYNYNSQLFVAEDVFLSKYFLSGHTLPQTVGEVVPVMEGTAESVEFTIKGEKIDFRAHHFKATFDARERKI